MSTTLPDHLQTLGEQLDVAWDRRYGAVPLVARRRRRVRGARAALVLAAVTAVVAAVFVRGSGPGAVGRALAAVGVFPADAIVHFTSVSRDPSGALISRAELWGVTSPPYARRWILESADAPAIEQGASGDEYVQYDPSGVVYVRTAAGGIAEGTRPADFGADAQRLKGILRAGDARDAGEVTVAGRTLRRFVFSLGRQTCTYDVEPEAFHGVSLVCTGLPTGSTSERWEYMPRKGNEGLLSVAAQHPSARIDRGPLRQCGPERHTPSTPPCVVYSEGG